MKEMICTATGLLGGLITTLFGGWSAGMTTLMVFMVADYLSGLIVAGVFKKSKKTESGALQSKVGWQGLCKKGMNLLIVLVAYRLDLTLGTTYIKDAVIIGFVLNETISIAENAGLMGVDLPPAIAKAIDILTDQTKQEK